MRQMRSLRLRLPTNGSKRPANGRHDGKEIPESLFIRVDRSHAIHMHDQIDELLLGQWLAKGLLNQIVDTVSATRCRRILLHEHVVKTGVLGIDRLFLCHAVEQIAHMSGKGAKANDERSTVTPNSS